MMSASIDTKVGLLREVGPDAAGEPSQSPVWSALKDRIGQLGRFLAVELGCPHDHFVYDDIGDVSWKHCGKDFTN